MRQVQPITGLRLDGGGAVDEEPVRPGLGEPQQGGGIGVPGGPHGAGDATLARLLRRVRGTAHSLRELVLSGTREDRVGVGINEAGYDAGTRRTWQATVEIHPPLHPASLTEPNHPSIARCQATFPDAAEGIAGI